MAPLRAVLGLALMAIVAPQLAADVVPLLVVAKGKPFRLGDKFSIRNGDSLEILASHPMGGVLVKATGKPKISADERWCLVMCGAAEPQLVATQHQDAPSDEGLLNSVRESFVNARGDVLFNVELRHPGKAPQSCWCVYSKGTLRQLPLGTDSKGRPRLEWRKARLLDDGRVVANDGVNTAVFDARLSEAPKDIAGLQRKPLYLFETDGQIIAGVIEDKSIPFVCDLRSAMLPVVQLSMPKGAQSPHALTMAGGICLFQTGDGFLLREPQSSDLKLILAKGRLQTPNEDGYLLGVQDFGVSPEGDLVVLAHVAPHDKPDSSYAAVLRYQDGHVTDLLPRLSHLQGNYDFVRLCSGQPIVVRRTGLYDGVPQEVVALRDGKPVSLLEKRSLGAFKQASLHGTPARYGSGRFFVVRDLGDMKAERFGVVDVLAP